MLIIFKHNTILLKTERETMARMRVLRTKRRSFANKRKVYVQVQTFNYKIFTLYLQYKCAIKHRGFTHRTNNKNDLQNQDNTTKVVVLHRKRGSFTRQKHRFYISKAVVLKNKNDFFVKQQHFYCFTILFQRSRLNFCIKHLYTIFNTSRCKI